MNDEPKATPSETKADEKTDEPRSEVGETTVGDQSAGSAGENPKSEDKDAFQEEVDIGAGDPKPKPSDEAVAKLVEALQAENVELKDRLLRAAAEMENMRRRSEREMADTRQYAVTGFAREVLSIGDNLNRAIAAVPEEASKEGGATKTLIEGVEMTERELHRVLNKHGVTKLEPEGKKFDPNMHQAMFEVKHDDAPHGTVVQVVQAGYSIGERVLRPAMVGVAKPAKKTEAADKAQDAEKSKADARPDENAAKADEGSSKTDGTPADGSVTEPKAANDS